MVTFRAGRHILFHINRYVVRDLLIGTTGPGLTEAFANASSRLGSLEVK